MVRNPNSGHRKRLRERFLKSDFDGFLDYEIIELLLTLATPQTDCKGIAKEAIKKFGGLRGVLDASLEELQEIKGIGQVNYFGLKLFQAMSERYAKEKISKNISFASPDDVAGFLRKKIGREKKEHFFILVLDFKNNLIKDTDVSVGILDANLVHPREVFREAVQASAAGVILAHNHPSGSLEPSDEDIAITRRLVEAGKILGIEILDHVIVAKTGFFSFKEEKFI